MRKSLDGIFFLLIIFICISSKSQAQTIELRQGLNLNRFFDLQKGEAPYNKPNYTTGLGSFFSVTLNNVKIDSFNFDFSIAFENYGGAARARFGGIGGGRSVYSETRKSVISIGVVPLKQQLYKNLKLDVGIIFSILVHESFKGNLTQSAGNIPTTISLTQAYTKFNSTFTLGLLARLKYDISLSDTYTLSPFYAYYFGILNEFKSFPVSTKSMRQQLGLGLTMDL